MASMLNFRSALKRVVVFLKGDRPKMVLFLIRLTALNVLVATGLCYINVWGLIGQMNLSEFVFTQAALFANNTLNIGLIFSALYLLSFRLGVRILVNASFWTFTSYQLLLVADSISFNISGFHFSAIFGVNFDILQAAFMEAFNLKTMLLALIGGALVLFVERRFIIAIMPHRKGTRLIKWPIRTSQMLYFFVFLVLAVITDKAFYVYALYTNNRLVKSTAYAIPFYHKSLVETLFYKPESHNADSEGALLHYPLVAMAPDAVKLYNILWVNLDGISANERKLGQMPQLELFAKKSQDFTNNFCASDNPRDNNFALYYGLWPNYFPTFMKTLRSPVLFEELTKNTYELRAFMAQDFALADDKQFLFLSIPHSDQSNPKATKLEQHNLLLQDFKSWQLTRETSLPFAAFIHFDLAKFPVDFDTTTVHERPYSKDLNILHPNQISGSMQNGYLNAVAYQDQLLGELLDFVSQHTWADQTIIVITSNGESVLALSNEKYHVPLLIYIPNQKGERATHYTTNLNIVPSLFKLLGYNMSPNSYCNAADLWDCKNADAIQLVSRKGQYEVTFNNQKFTFSQEQFEQFDSLMDRTQLKALAKSITNENHKFYN